MLLKAKTDMLMTIWGGGENWVGWRVGSWLSGLSDGWGYYYLLKVEKFPRNRFGKKLSLILSMVPLKNLGH